MARKLKPNKPKRTPGARKKFVVLARNKQGKTKLVRFGDPNMAIKKHIKKRRQSFRARHRCDSAPPDILTPRYWSCKMW
tara:strand:+ start:300 stop:536 length:237 start_codon:yes stop_codon:yes gene_type:complete